VADVSTAFATETIETKQEEQPKAEATAAPKEEAKEPDWKAEATAAKAEIAKLQADLKTNAGRRQTEAQREAREAATLAEIKELRLGQLAIAEHFAAGDKADPAKLKAKLDEASKQTTLLQNQEQAGVEWQRFVTNATDLLRDEKKNPMFDLQNAPELEEWRKDALKEYQKVENGQSPDQSKLYDLKVKLLDIKFNHRIKTRESELATEREARKNTRKEVIKDLGLDDMDIGGSASGGNPSLEVLVKKDTRYMNQSELAAHGKALDTAMRRG